MVQSIILPARAASWSPRAHMKMPVKLHLQCEDEVYVVIYIRDNTSR